MLFLASATSRSWLCLFFPGEDPVATPSISKHLDATFAATCAATSLKRATRGYTAPRSRSSSVTRSATASAAARNMGDRTRFASANVKPNANPGNTYALVDGRGAICFPVVLSTNGSTGHPEANTHRPSVASYASCAKHSAIPSGRDNAKMSGFFVFSPIARSTSAVNRRGGPLWTRPSLLPPFLSPPSPRSSTLLMLISATPATPPAESSLYPSKASPSGPASAPMRSECLCLRTPMSAVGFTARTASSTVPHSGMPSCAYGSLCNARSSSISALCRVTKPPLSTIQMRRLASATVVCVSRATYSARISPMPCPVSPAPAMRYVCSCTASLVFLPDAMTPASVVAATPCMSSLNTAACVA
mmetsp:Transcript_15918/g.67096  ORF Transcript_15918/g.67096 Transcript_15918/m.67096 type:complete len:361 (+) Transcript_15918:1915-2997(+)